MKTRYKDLSGDVKEFESSLSYHGIVMSEDNIFIYPCFTIEEFWKYCKGQRNHKKLFYRGCESIGKSVYGENNESFGIDNFLEWVYIEEVKVEKVEKREEEVKLVSRKAR